MPYLGTIGYPIWLLLKWPIYIHTIRLTMCKREIYILNIFLSVTENYIKEREWNRTMKTNTNPTKSRIISLICLCCIAKILQKMFCFFFPFQATILVGWNWSRSDTFSYFMLFIVVFISTVASIVLEFPCVGTWNTQYYAIVFFIISHLTLCLYRYPYL